MHAGVGEPVIGAVRLRVLGRRLTGNLGDVVVQAVVAGGVVVLKELTLLAQRAVQVGGDGAGSEGGVVALVLELDDQYVIDPPRGKGGTDGVGGGALGSRRRGDEEERDRGRQRYEGERTSNRANLHEDRLRLPGAGIGAVQRGLDAHQRRLLALHGDPPDPRRP